MFALSDEVTTCGAGRAQFGIAAARGGGAFSIG
jgi:hypothetical protein